MKTTRRPCSVCGVDCFWNAFDQRWDHMRRIVKEQAEELVKQLAWGPEE